MPLAGGILPAVFLYDPGNLPWASGLLDTTSVCLWVESDWKENAVAHPTPTSGYLGLEFCYYPDTLGRGCSPGQTKDKKQECKEGEFLRKECLEQISGPVWTLTWPAPTC